MGSNNVLLDNICVAVKVTIESVKSGRNNIFFDEVRILLSAIVTLIKSLLERV
jgi:hypothetical protein